MKSFVRNLLPIPFTAVKLNLRYRWLYSLGPEILEQSMHIVKRILLDYGFVRSMKEHRCVDAEGRAIPWITYSAIRFLESLDFAGARVFEYGSGASTLWWKWRGALVTSVDHDPAWAEKVRAQSGDPDLILETDKKRYADSILSRPQTYDVVVVDGWQDEHDFLRYRCVAAALQRLTRRGIIVLDNSEWLPKTCALLREAGWEQVDFEGPCPGNAEFGRTSVFWRGKLSFNYVERPVVGGFRPPRNLETGPVPQKEKQSGALSTDDRTVNSVL
jgi:hypothetical protein